ncbi:MAG: hypothetical protein KGQ88_02500 [Chloroflexi bacterium]|nr:hypothetical protein [Chloroflexota bacterium]
MTELEKRGVPTVGIVAQPFRKDAVRTAETFGLPELQFSIVPEAFTSQPRERIRDMVDAAFDDIVRRLREDATAGEKVESEIVTLPDEWLSFGGDDAFEAMRLMNETFLEYQWSDGLPLLPPTRAAMAAMLSGAERDPDDVVAVLEPGFGLATVRKIAANAVMAGCSPAHLPVVIAAVEALADPHMDVRDKAMSTGMAAPLVVVNGPIRTRIGMNTGICSLGPGSPSHVNTVIGRAVRLCMMNVGRTYPGISDMDTIGSPMKYSMVVAENEEESPWDSYAAEKGFDAGTSTVTIQFCYGHTDLHDMWNTDPNKVIQVYATAPKYMGVVSSGLWLVGRRSDPRHGTEEKEGAFLLLSPQRANAFARNGWDKRTIRAALYKEARASFRTLMFSRDPKMFAHPELSWLWDSPDTMLPILEDESCFGIAVTGRGLSRDAYFWGMGGAVTKAIGK